MAAGRQDGNVVELEFSISLIGDEADEESTVIRMVPDDEMTRARLRSGPGTGDGKIADLDARLYQVLLVESTTEVVRRSKYSLSVRLLHSCIYVTFGLLSDRLWRY